MNVPYRKKVVQELGAEPLLLGEVKDHLRVTHDEHDDLIMSLITAAREQVEYDCQLSLAKKNIIVSMDSFPTYSGEIILPDGPVTKINSVKYYDTSNIDTTFTDYWEDLNQEQSRIVAKNGWPSTYVRPGCVRIDYEAGYDFAKVPEKLRQAMKLLIATWYDNASDVTGTSLSTLPRGYLMLIGGWVSL